MLRRIFDEACPDFSAEICPNATQADLEPEAVAQFRSRWWRHSRNDSLQERSQDRLLRDAELVTEGGITYAALILLGTHVALGKHLAQAEIVFEYRSSEAPGPASQREEFREGFFSFLRPPLGSRESPQRQAALPGRPLHAGYSNVQRRRCA
jgi:ATP-dependent DNA helicase RecG